MIMKIVKIIFNIIFVLGIMFSFLIITAGSNDSDDSDDEGMAATETMIEDQSRLYDLTRQ